MSDKINEKKHVRLLITPTRAAVTIIAVGIIKELSKFLQPKGQSNTPRPSEAPAARNAAPPFDTTRGGGGPRLQMSLLILTVSASR